MARFAFQRQIEELARIELSEPAIKRVRFVFPCRARTKARFAFSDPSPDEGRFPRKRRGWYSSYFAKAKCSPGNLGSPLPLARSDRRRVHEAPRGCPERPPEPRYEVEGVGARIGAAFASAKDVTTAATLGAAGPWSARRRSRRDGLGTAG